MSVDAADADGAKPVLDGAAIPDGGSAYVAAVLADSPIAYYPLEESSGTDARDVIGGRNGAWVGQVALGVPGVVGAGARLDGESTRLELPPGSFSFAGKAPYSIEAWLSPTVVDGRVRFLLDHGARNGVSAGYQIYFNDEFFLCSRSDNNGNADGYGAITPIPSAQFAHITMTYDGTVVHLFANGSSRGPANGVLALPSVTGAQLVFGDSVGGQFFKLASVIDEIAIYDHALPAERVLAHYAARPK